MCVLSSHLISSPGGQDGLCPYLSWLPVTFQHSVLDSASSLKATKQNQTWKGSVGSSASLGRFLAVDLALQCRVPRRLVRISFIYYVHKNLGNMKAPDKVLTLKAATAHCVDQAEAPEYVHKQE